MTVLVVMVYDCAQQTGLDCHDLVFASPYCHGPTVCASTIATFTDERSFTYEARRYFRRYFYGSSPNSGKRGSDFEEEVLVVAETVGHPLDYLDAVVDAFDQVGSERPPAVREDSR